GSRDCVRISRVSGNKGDESADGPAAGPLPVKNGGWAECSPSARVERNARCGCRRWSGLHRGGRTVWQWHVSRCWRLLCGKHASEQERQAEKPGRGTEECGQRRSQSCIHERLLPL